MQHRIAFFHLLRLVLFHLKTLSHAVLTLALVKTQRNTLLDRMSNESN